MILADKQRLRAALLARRRVIAAERLRAASAALTKQLLAHALWREARNVAAFVGVRGEVDTRALIEASLAAGKTVYLPRLCGVAPAAFVDPIEGPIPMTERDVRVHALATELGVELLGA